MQKCRKVKIFPVKKNKSFYWEHNDDEEAKNLNESPMSFRNSKKFKKPKLMIDRNYLD